ncbi:Flp family type IVb pilin [[Haemophilus] ducreyi]|uniref:Flp family type IVb pilin n=1 Tax=Haemophilus ducreyi TaxID=730 RepID=UPI0006552D5D|nr:Flp family type IVb pilin [[Haemophilus] ducreyi]AKO45544.1 fimbrial protein [[Haemophilus] ducreyi]AKO46930.1 fimbrial protein [[Haemophilus] ducreyi]AKO48271.1 fimbrial protein [[Haemophilus] ducreyi]AKO49661.1 fimbrial protein [[Haemophilus] ducreyi]ANF62575.1 fimbrial protein [[Haemophilus] ducreyi]
MLSTLTTKAYISTSETLRNKMKTFRQDQQGVTAIEYGLIAVAVAVLIIAVFYSEDGFLFKLREKFFHLEVGLGNAAPDGDLINFNKARS